MSFIKEFFLGQREERMVHDLNTPVSGTVPIQHAFSEGTKAIENLPIVRKCLGYVADTINECVPRIVTADVDRAVIAEGESLPKWIRQPSAEYVFAELVQQAVWSVFVDGEIKLLATVGKSSRQPSFMYVGTSNVVTRHSNGQVIYVDYNPGAVDGEIVANTISHRRRLAAPGRPQGIGEFGPSKTLLNTALHAQDLLDKFFASNMHLDLLFSYEGEYVKGAGRELLRQLAKKHSGGRNAYRPIVSDRKWKVDRIRDSNQANQLVELVQMINSNIVTSVFGIDPLVFSLGVSTGTSVTYQNASNLRSQVWLQAVKPIALLIAGCISDYLPRGQIFEFSAADLLRGSPSDRATLVEKMTLAGSHNGAPVFFETEMRDVLGYTGDPPDPPPLPEPSESAIIVS